MNKALAQNIWYDLRVETDTTLGKAVVKLNGKVIGTADFDTAADFIDGTQISFIPTTDAQFSFDEVRVWKNFEYNDYVPEPKSVESKNYILGINVCSIWREGYHKGWAAIAPYDEIAPVLGFYDEGSPEAADWEIKFWAEHGIDYQMLCWYGTGAGSPVKLSRGATSELHSGYFNAKYSDKVKFAIMWENSTATTTLEQFKEYVVPYWVEYYLTDPRYMTVDNKPVISIWSVGSMISKFGGADKAKEGIEFLRQTCKALGYDDAIILVADGHATRKDQVEVLASIGADATYAYHFNEGGAKFYNQISRMQMFLDTNIMSMVPTVSVGFNSVAWHNKRTGLIEPDSYSKVTDFIKNTALKATDNSKSVKNMVMISTWNEYGEGTYMMPSKTLGFTYLDEVRKAFTDSTGTDNDLVPTEAQKDRICKLFPQEKTNIAPLFKEDVSEYPQETAVAFPFISGKLDESWTVMSQKN